MTSPWLDLSDVGSEVRVESYAFSFGGYLIELLGDPPGSAILLYNPELQSLMLGNLAEGLAKLIKIEGPTPLGLQYADNLKVGTVFEFGERYRGRKVELHEPAGAKFSGVLRGFSEAPVVVVIVELDLADAYCPFKQVAVLSVTIGGGAEVPSLIEPPESVLQERALPVQ